MNLHRAVFTATLVAGIVLSPAASAQVQVSIGSNVVTNPDRTANFSSLGLFSNIGYGYVENGIAFNFDQSQGHANAYIVNSSWQCCGGLMALQGFTGNVGYFNSDGWIPYKYASISSSDSVDFSALQFQLASGYGGSTHAFWQAFDNGTEVGAGSFTIAATSNFAPATQVAFYGADFDELRIGTYYQTFSTFSFQGVNGNAAEIANVLANVNAVPEPETYAMLLAGLGLLGVALRRRRRN